MRGGKQPAFVVVAMAAALFAGCASPQFKRIEGNREIYESWPIEIQQAVLDGKVEAGMTPDMVKVAWGKPTEVIARSSTPGDEEIWVYRTGGDPDPMMTTTSPMIMSPTGGIGITTGRGGTTIGTNMGTGIGMGGTGGMGGPIMAPMPMPTTTLPPAPVEEREVVFRNGVVYRADSPK